MPRTIGGRIVAGPRGGVGDEVPPGAPRPDGGVLDARSFRQVVSNFLTGVTVVTVPTEEGLRGITVNSFTSLSLDPPLVLVCVDRFAQSHDWIAEAGVFAVNLLSDEQEILSEQFASRAPLVDPNFEGVPHRFATTGAPIVDGCLGWMDCRVWATYDGGDHTIFVGEVKAAGFGPGRPPLAYFRSSYAHLQAP